MRLTCPRLTRTLLGFALACQAGEIAAEATGVFEAPSGGRLDPGVDLVASWTLDARAVQDRDEAELVLSLDGGVSFPVRLTGRIAPDARAAHWRVPALPTEHARLALRAGSHEESDAEEILLVSEPFAIASARDLPREQLFCVSGEWRTRAAIEGAPTRPAERDFEPDGPGPTIDPLDADDDGLETGPAAAVPVGGQAPIGRPHPLSRTHSSIGFAVSVSAATPLRL